MCRWCWQQPVRPHKQSVQLVGVDGQPVTVSVQDFGTWPGTEKCTHVSLAVADEDGCSAHHVRFDSGKGEYSAASIDCGAGAMAVRDVVWTEDPGSGAVVML